MATIPEGDLVNSRGWNPRKRRDHRFRPWRGRSSQRQFDPPKRLRPLQGRIVGYSFRGLHPRLL